MKTIASVHQWILVQGSETTNQTGTNEQVTDIYPDSTVINLTSFCRAVRPDHRHTHWHWCLGSTFLILFGNIQTPLLVLRLANHSFWSVWLTHSLPVSRCSARRRAGACPSPPTRSRRTTFWQVLVFRSSKKKNSASFIATILPLTGSPAWKVHYEPEKTLQKTNQYALFQWEGN